MAVAYLGQCGNCTSYDTNNEYCDYYKQYCEPGDTCRYQEDRKTDSDCYITTIVCDILGFEDNCSVLETLRSFRKNILQTNEKYKDILYEYDTVGPIIAERLKNDFVETKSKDLAEKLYQNYIRYTLASILREDNKKAVEKYTEMTELLKEYCGLPKERLHAPENYNFKKGGHGKVKIKVEE